MPICVQEGTVDDASLMTVDPEELRRRKTAHMKGGISKQELIAASIYLRALNPRTVELAKSLPPRGAPARGDQLWSVGYIIHCALLGLAGILRQPARSRARQFPRAGSASPRRSQPTSVGCIIHCALGDSAGAFFCMAYPSATLIAEPGKR